MPATSDLTEDTVHRIAPDAAAVQAGRGLLRKRAFKNLGRSADGTWLLAECQGSGKDPYQVSVDLGDPAVPVGRCNCPSRKFPCKHALGLMLAFLEAGDGFDEREPPADLLAKREKTAQRKETREKAEPRKVNQSALKKKAQAQRQGLDLLEKLLLDMVAGGQWSAPDRLQRLERQALQMNDHYLPGAARMLRQLVEQGGRKRADEERNEVGSDILGMLWATVQRGRNYLDGKLAGEETQAEADAVVEDVLGKTWQLAELKEKGYFRPDLQLLELAFETRDDGARQERVETSYLLELRGGEVLQAVTYRPFKGLKQIPEQPSYGQALNLKEAAVYPGFLCRRVRWDRAVENAEPVEPRHLQAAYDRANPDFARVLTTYRQNLKNPLAREAVAAFLVRCARVGRVGDQVVLEDAGGNRLATGVPTGDQPNVANLVRAAGMVRVPAVLIRFFLTPSPARILALPLAALTPEVHLRLGL